MKIKEEESAATTTTTTTTMRSYEEIKSICEERKVLWEDPDFPAAQASVFYHQTPPFAFEWKRPTEFVISPAFLSTDCQIIPGKLGDRWLASCLGCLRLTEGLLYRVVPADQSFRSNDGYVGVFRFRIWWRGEWTEVTIDDRLPTVKNQLVFMNSQNSMQFWPALLEKAYAKLHGSYEALKYGTLLDGMADLTGGVTESVSLKKEAAAACNGLLKSLLEMTSIVTCRINSNNNNEDSDKNEKPQPETTSGNTTANGLRVGDSYRVLSLHKVRSRNGSGEEVEAVKLRGHAGAFAAVNNKRPYVKTPNNNEDGGGITDFAMPYLQFLKTFTHLDVIHLDGETARDEPSLENKEPWNVKSFGGQWKKGVSAGGCRNYTDTFFLNPQLLMTSPSADDAILSVSQFNALEPQVIGFSAYALNDDEETAELEADDDAEEDVVMKQFFKSRRSLFNSQYTNSRQVALRCKLEPGKYLVLPTTYEPGQEAAFSFRVLSKSGVRIKLRESQPRLLRSPLVRATEGTKGLSQYQSLFSQSADDQQSVDAFELQELLEICLPNDYIKSCGSIEVCRLVISALDNKGFGRINYKEFKDLICSIKFWHSVFKNHAKEKVGILRAERFRDALAEVGFRLNYSIISSLLAKYIRKDGTLRFGDFVASILCLTISFNSFYRRDHGKTGHIKLSQAEFIKMNLSC